MVGREAHFLDKQLEAGFLPKAITATGECQFRQTEILGVWDETAKQNSAMTFRVTQLDTHLFHLVGRSRWMRKQPKSFQNQVPMLSARAP